jgi:hypothetical protein
MSIFTADCTSSYKENKFSRLQQQHKTGLPDGPPGRGLHHLAELSLPKDMEQLEAVPRELPLCIFLMVTALNRQHAKINCRKFYYPPPPPTLLVTPVFQSSSGMEKWKVSVCKQSNKLADSRD